MTQAELHGISKRRSTAMIMTLLGRTPSLTSQEKQALTIYFGRKYTVLIDLTA